MDFNPKEGESPKEYAERLGLAPSDRISFFLSNVFFKYCNDFLKEGYTRLEINEGIQKLIIVLVCSAAARLEDPKEYLHDLIKSITKNLKPVKNQLDKKELNDFHA